MKISRSLKPLGRGAIAAALALGLGACGDDESSPEAISADDLNGPGGLRLTDDGGGTVTLWWVGQNNEDDFEGYNVYGMYDEEGDLTADEQEGKAVELLDQEGNPVAAAKGYRSEVVDRYFGQFRHVHPRKARCEGVH